MREGGNKVFDENCEFYAMTSEVYAEKVIEKTLKNS